MAGKFLNLDDDDLDLPVPAKIGSGLKSKPKKPRVQADKAAVAAAGKAHGFNRTTEAAAPPQPSQGQRRGRPPLNEDMTYWRIYVSSDLRNELNQLRDEEGRRLNDVMADMLAAYRKRKS